MTRLAIWSLLIFLIIPALQADNQCITVSAPDLTVAQARDAEINQLYAQCTLGKAGFNPTPYYAFVSLETPTTHLPGGLPLLFVDGSTQGIPGVPYSINGVRFPFLANGRSQTFTFNGFRMEPMDPGAYKFTIQFGPNDDGSQIESSVSGEYDAVVPYAFNAVGGNQKSIQTAVNSFLNGSCSGISPPPYTNAGGLTVTVLHPEVVRAADGTDPGTLFHVQIRPVDGGKFPGSKFFVNNSIVVGSAKLARVTSPSDLTQVPELCPGTNISAIDTGNLISDWYLDVIAYDRAKDPPNTMWRLDVLPGYLTTQPFQLEGRVWREGDVSPQHLAGADWVLLGAAEDPSVTSPILTVKNPGGPFDIHIYPPPAGTSPGPLNPKRIVGGSLTGNSEAWSNAVARLNATAEIVDQILGKSLPLDGNIPSTPGTFPYDLSKFDLTVPGKHPFDVKVTAPASKNNPVTVHLGDATVHAPGSTPIITFVGSAADYRAIVTPGGLIYVSCLDCGPNLLVPGTADSSGRLGTLAGGIQLEFAVPGPDGNTIPVLAPVYYAAPGAAAAFAPYELAGSTEATLTWINNLVRSPAFKVPVADASPAFFTTPYGGIASINQAGTVNSPAFPALKATVIALYATGGGLTEDPANAVNGKVVNGLSPLKLPVAVTIGGQLVGTTYAGLAPGLYSGVVQINAMLPDSLGEGRQPVVMKVGNFSSVYGTINIAK